MFALVIGYPLAYFIALTGGRWKDLLIGLVVVPFFTSYLIRTIAWKSILADDSPIHRWTSPADRVSTLGSDDFRFLSTAMAVIGGLTYNFLPFMILPDLREPREDRLPPDRRRRRPVRHALARRSGR